MADQTSRRAVLGTVAFATVTAGCLDEDSDGNGKTNTDNDPENGYSTDRSDQSADDPESNTDSIQNESDNGTTNSGNSSGSDPDRITWHARAYSDPPDEDGTVYQPDHDLLKEFSPVEDLLDRADEEDISDGYTLAAPTINYDTEKAKNTREAWEEIEADADGQVFVEYEEWYLRLIYATETDE